MIKRILLIVLSALLVMPVAVYAGYSAAFVDPATSANVGDTFAASVQVTNSSGSGSGSGTVTLTIDSEYFSTSDSLSKTCTFSGTTCTSTWMITAMKGGTRSMSATAMVGNDAADANSPNVVISNPTTYVLTFTPSATTYAPGLGTITLSLSVTNNGGAAATTATLDYGSFSLTRGSATQSLGTIPEGGSSSATWYISPGSGISGTKTVTVTVSGGDVKTSSLSFTCPTCSGGDDGSTTTTSGGGGGGGGAASATSITHSWNLIEVVEGMDALMTIDKLLISFTEIQIDIKEAVSNAKLTVAKLSEKPSTIVQNPSGTVYQYIRVTPKNLNDSNIIKAIIKFKVGKTWIAENNIDASGVVLKRYSDDNWNELKTTKMSSDANYTYYEAESPGFSTFAITGTVKIEAPTGEAITPIEEKEDGIIEETYEEVKEQIAKIVGKKYAGPVVVLGLLALALVIGVYTYKKKGKHANRITKLKIK